MEFTMIFRPPQLCHRRGTNSGTTRILETAAYREAVRNRHDTGSLSLVSNSPTMVGQGYVEGEYLSSPRRLVVASNNCVYKQGQRSPKDSALFSLDKEAEIANIDEAKARALAAAQALNTEKGKRKEEIAVTRAQLASAEAQTALAKTNCSANSNWFARFHLQSQIDDATAMSN